MVRAKFRCMTTSQHFHGQMGTAEFLPVNSKKDEHHPEGTEENALFWKWTPCGGAKLRVPLDDDAYKIGRCFYIDMEHNPEGGWSLRSRTQREDQIDICLTRGFGEEVQMTINNEAAWPAFLTGKVGAPWAVTFIQC